MSCQTALHARAHRAALSRPDGLEELASCTVPRTRTSRTAMFGRAAKPSARTSSTFVNMWTCRWTPRRCGPNPAAPAAWKQRQQDCRSQREIRCHRRGGRSTGVYRPLIPYRGGNEPRIVYDRPDASTWSPVTRNGARRNDNRFARSAGGTCCRSTTMPMWRSGRQ